jgi:hypothetical protein
VKGEVEVTKETKLRNEINQMLNTGKMGKYGDTVALVRVCKRQTSILGLLVQLRKNRAAEKKNQYFTWNGICWRLDVGNELRAALPTKNLPTLVPHVNYRLPRCRCYGYSVIIQEEG